ncbi:MAG: U32 family peptidase [Oligoflexia bacterium]|nr:U32 family peptidase [Oligoflexia bacterium]MBF0367019.1 U32 family peptidase [Oligoflexia bacterium]
MMKKVLLHGLFQIADDHSEVILEHVCLSRLGMMSSKEMISAIHECKRKGVRAFLAVDCLLIDEKWDEICKALDELELVIGHVAAIRVLDIGVLQLIRERFPKKKIHLLLEHGPLNFEGLIFWKQHLGDCLERLVLSTQITKEQLEKYVSDPRMRDLQLEILVFGPLMMSYTSRSLLGLAGGDEQIVEIKSLESFDLEISVIQNRHGSFIFHKRPLSIEHLLPDLLKEKLYLRYDYRLFYKDKMNFTEGLFMENSTGKIFDKLKNNLLRTGNGENYLGEVVQVEKGCYIAVLLKSFVFKLSVGDEIEYALPTGERISTKVNEIRNSRAHPVTDASYQDLVLLKYHSKITARSIVYKL